MRSCDFSRYALSSCAALVLLAGCGGSQPPIGSLGALPQASAPVVHTNSSSYKVVYSFGAPPDGQQPAGNVIEAGGTLYGITQYGGAAPCNSSYYYGCGTIFSLKAGAEHVLHSFSYRDGAQPRAGLIAVNGTFYGTTFYGGAHDWGTVYSVTPSGAETVLHDFGDRRDGGLPSGTLIHVDGKLYGTTRRGGTHPFRNAKGTVFAITMGGKGKVLYRFAGTPDGEAPFADLLDAGGTLYGTTAFGGAYGDGTVFTITKRGAENVLYSFKGADGKLPGGGLVDVGGTLYGTTVEGGAYTGGTVFSISPGGSERVLHSFGSGADGNGPNGSLIAAKGTLYGTTTSGGSPTCPFGCGTVFSITTSGTENVIYSFGKSPDGNVPLGGLLDVGGTLYGTTSMGGTYGNGTVYALRP